MSTSPWTHSISLTRTCSASSSGGGRRWGSKSFSCLQHVGAGDVAAADRGAETGWADAPEARAAVEQRPEDALGVEARETHPLERSIRSDQRACVAVRDEPVGRDPWEPGLEVRHAPGRLFGRRGRPGDAPPTLSRITPAA